MQISNHHNKSLFSYVMNGTSLAVTEQHLYLGVKLHLIQNSQAVKKCAALKKAMVKKDVKSKVAAKKWL